MGRNCHKTLQARSDLIHFFAVEINLNIEILYMRVHSESQGLEPICIALGENNTVWALDTSGSLWFRTGVTAKKPQGEDDHWWQVHICTIYPLLELVGIFCLYAGFNALSADESHILCKNANYSKSFNLFFLSLKMFRPARNVSK